MLSKLFRLLICLAVLYLALLPHFTRFAIADVINECRQKDKSVGALFESKWELEEIYFDIERIADLQFGKLELSSSNGAYLTISGKGTSVENKLNSDCYETSIPGLELAHSTYLFGVNGHGGCNSFNAVAMVNEGAASIRFVEIEKTKVACNPGMRTESNFLKHLLRVNRYTIVSQRLMLYEADKILLEFSRTGR